MRVRRRVIARADEFSFAPRSVGRERVRNMPMVRLRGPLVRLAGGEAQHDVRGAVVSELLRALEEQRPELRGWILDEHGRVRRHINVFVNGDYAQAGDSIEPGDRVEILPAISGGAQ
jgi:molybdopterin synthase sulfur carrier subunit